MPAILVSCLKDSQAKLLFQDVDWLWKSLIDTRTDRCYLILGKGILTLRIPLNIQVKKGDFSGDLKRPVDPIETSLLLKAGIIIPEMRSVKKGTIKPSAMVLENNTNMVVGLFSTVENELLQPRTSFLR